MISVVTGASRGIGRATALRMATTPDCVVYALARSEDKLIELAREHAKIIPVACDLGTEEGIAKALNEISHDAIDILINNAGALINKPFEETSLNDFNHVYNVNVFGPARLIGALMPQLKQAENGAHVVNIGSVGGFQGSSKFPGLAAYSSSKAAIASLTECLAEEYKESKVRFNCLALGAVQTEMLAEAFPGFTAPLSAEEMGQYIAEFARTGNKTFNGKILPVALSTP